MKNLLMMFVILSGVAAQASVESIQAAQSKCLETAVSNMEMKMCTGEAYDAADRELNVVYNKAVSELRKAKETEILKRLIKAERAWVSHRDANCDLEATEMLGGSGEGLVYISCEVDMTLERITYLNKMFSSSAK